MSQEPSEAVKPYLAYLDKESTVQGVLSGACVTACGLLLHHVLLPKIEAVTDISHALDSQSAGFTCAVLSLLVAGLLFFQQRSDTMWLLSIFTLALARDGLNMETPKDSFSLMDCMEKADSWIYWWPYRSGWAMLYASAVEVALAVTALVWHRSWFERCPWCWAIITGVSGLLYIGWLWLDLKAKDRQGSGKRVR
jgi:hypothetical protein